MHPAFAQHLVNCEYLSREEERDLIARAQAGCKESMDRVVRSVLRLVVRLATKYRKLVNNDFDLALSCALQALMNAIRLFDPSRGCRLGTAAGSAIHFELIKEQFKLAPVHLPASCNGAEKTRKHAEQALKATNNVYSRYNEPVFVQSESESQLDADRKAVSAAMIWLDAREQEVLLHRMNGLKLEEVGKLFGICKERVRQIEERAIEKLQMHVKAA